MLSNDLISLSVSPVSHQGPAVSSAAPRPRVPPGPGAAATISACRHQKQDRSFNLQKMCQGKVTGDAGGKRLWNESAGYFIYHIHSIRQCGAVNQCPCFFFFLIHIYLGWAGEGLGGLSGEGSGTRREGVAVTARLSRLSQIQFEQSQRPEWIYYQTCPKLQHLTEGAAVSTSSWEGEERMRQGCGHM